MDRQEHDSWNRSMIKCRFSGEHDSTKLFKKTSTNYIFNILDSGELTSLFFYWIRRKFLCIWNVFVNKTIQFLNRIKQKENQGSGSNRNNSTGQVTFLKDKTDSFNQAGLRYLLFRVREIFKWKMNSSILTGCILLIYWLILTLINTI